MMDVFDMRREQAAGKFHWLPQILQRFYRDTKQGVDDRQVVTGVGKLDLGRCIEGCQSIAQISFNL